MSYDAPQKRSKPKSKPAPKPAPKPVPKPASKPAPKPASKPAPGTPAARPPTARPVPAPATRPPTPKPKATPPPKYVYVSPRVAPRPRTVVAVYTRRSYWATNACSYGSCQADFDNCMTVFDGCACFPGLLSCAKQNCATEFNAAATECLAAKTQVTGCVLTCSAGAYPSTYADATEYSLWTAVTIQGASAASFQGSEYDFAAAVANITSDDFLTVTTDMVYIASAKDLVAGSSRQLESLVVSLDVQGNVEQRQQHEHRHLADGTTLLAVEFVVLFDTYDDLNGTAAYFGSLMDVTAAADNDLAVALVARGVLFNESQLTIESVRTMVTPIFTSHARNRAAFHVGTFTMLLVTVAWTLDPT
ncbi:hypothetical protein DYB25_001774 [Aphanomyces astaci]|uniref:Uncharacterized protein n=1 Tax=Aphanomyces astaci TaxID=112090 RepID=A0A397ABG4_APHAT|nr:hypothetical protein DYB25_001774 [Aphanomyces astaci]RHY63624.1 hypothetical protein DYB34_001551 [Aphanomyces astaci]